MNKYSSWKKFWNSLHEVIFFSPTVNTDTKNVFQQPPPPPTLPGTRGTTVSLARNLSHELLAPTALTCLLRREKNKQTRIKEKNSSLSTLVVPWRNSSKQNFVLELAEKELCERYRCWAVAGEVEESTNTLTVRTLSTCVWFFLWNNITRHDIIVTLCNDLRWKP